MNGQKHISKADEALQSLDGMQRAAAPPFLYTRVQARLRAEAPQALTLRDRLAALLARPAVALGCIIVILTLNALLILNRGGNGGVNIPATGELTADAYNANVALVDESDNIYDQ